jgi:hypothetical protein
MPYWIHPGLFIAVPVLYILFFITVPSLVPVLCFYSSLPLIGPSYYPNVHHCLFIGPYYPVVHHCLFISTYFPGPSTVQSPSLSPSLYYFIPSCCSSLFFIDSSAIMLFITVSFRKWYHPVIHSCFFFIPILSVLLIGLKVFCCSLLFLCWSECFYPVILQSNILSVSCPGTILQNVVHPCP